MVMNCLNSQAGVSLIPMAKRNRGSGTTYLVQNHTPIVTYSLEKSNRSFPNLDRR